MHSNTKGQQLKANPWIEWVYKR